MQLLENKGVLRSQSNSASANTQPIEVRARRNPLDGFRHVLLCIGRPQPAIAEFISIYLIYIQTPAREAHLDPT
jgi:hypothetical protein